MTETWSPDRLAATFEAERSRLQAVAYRMLGSRADSQDVVQEAWLRLSRQDATAIDNLAGWLTTVVSRISLDVLRSRKARPETSTDESSTSSGEPGADGETVEGEVVLADSIGVALLVVLDALAPSERLAFVLHDLFAVPIDEVARILGRTGDATKMLASRARRKVRGRASGAAPSPAQREIVEAFLAAARDGDFDRLLRVLDPDVRLTVDTGHGRSVVLGATTVAARARFGAGDAERSVRIVVGGRPSVLSWRADGTLLALLTLTIADDVIIAISALTDPVRLSEVAAVHGHRAVTGSSIGSHP